MTYPSSETTTRTGSRKMPRSAREWFLILDDKLRMVGPRDYPDATSAILVADHQAPWPTFRGRLVVRSNYNEDGVKIGDGQGRIAATRVEGRWSGPNVIAGSGYLVDPLLNAAHEREVNLPRTTKTPEQLRREIEEALRRPRRR